MVLLGPVEGLLLEFGERCHDDAEISDELAVVATSPRKPRNPLAESGVGQVFKAATLSLSMATPSAEMTWPRYATDGAPKMHLERLRWSW